MKTNTSAAMARATVNATENSARRRRSCVAHRQNAKGSPISAASSCHDTEADGTPAVLAAVREDPQGATRPRFVIGARALGPKRRRACSDRTRHDGRMARRAWMPLLLIAVIAFLVNFFAGIEDRCSDQGWSGCGWIYQLTGWTVLASVGGVLVLGILIVAKRSGH